MRLADKIALITGAAGGIGAAAAALFTAEGAKVFLVDVNYQGLEELAQSLGEDRAAFFTADMAQESDVANMVQAACDRFGGLDVALLNAGIEGTVSPITDYPTDMFDKVIAINMRGVWLGLKYIIPAMDQRGGGSIVLTSSIAGVRGRPKMSAYVASKHAVVGLARTAALECANKGIRVNSINPSPVDTRMMRSLEQQFQPDDPGQFRTDYAKASPLGRYATPEEIAKTMLYLASDDSAHCTGGVYMIDGGRSAH